MTTDTTYNGWTNYETWNVKLWLDNDEGTYDVRWYEAHRYAQSCGDSAYRLGGTLEEKATLYYGVYSREMHAFEQLEKMRKPVPNQAQVDALAAEILGPNRCPGCDLPTPNGHCAHCDYQLEA